MPPEHVVLLFCHGLNQALQISREFELKGFTAVVCKVGDRLVIMPIGAHRLLEFLTQWEPPEDAFEMFVD